MRPTMRLLLVGVVLCISLGISEPVRADDGDLPLEYYSGSFYTNMYTETKQNVSAMKAEMDATIKIYWSINGIIDIHVMTPNEARLTVGPEPFETYVNQKATVEIKANGKTCKAHDLIEGEGSFKPNDLKQLTDDYSNYKLVTKSFTTDIRWSGLESWKHSENSAGSVQKCGEWGKILTAAQEKAIEEASKAIKEIVFTVESVNPDSIQGRCDLPQWKNAVLATDADVNRVVESCSWRVIRIGSREWEGL